jgi:predicted RND superfamily exporter protein
LNTSGKAVFFTVTAVVFGVLVFVLSPLKFQMELGSMIALIIFLNGLGALVLTAPIVYLLKPKFIFKKRGV